MTAHPPPAPASYGAGPPRSQKYRPRVWWFVAGGVLIVLAVAAFVGALVFLLGPLIRQDAVFDADETPTQVSLPAGTDRALFVDGAGAVDCKATDGSGADLDFRPVGGELTFNQWHAVSRFHTGDGEVTFDCTGTAAAQVRVGQLPSSSAFVGGLLVGILGPLVLGGTGLVVLIVTLVLYLRRPPRPT